MEFHKMESVILPLCFRVKNNYDNDKRELNEKNVDNL